VNVNQVFAWRKRFRAVKTEQSLIPRYDVSEDAGAEIIGTEAQSHFGLRFRIGSNSGADGVRGSVLTSVNSPSGTRFGAVISRKTDGSAINSMKPS
jgi:hypothetical protein